MAYDNKENRLRRKEAVGMEQLVRSFIQEMRISSGLNAVRAAEAWNEASGASIYTLDVNLHNAVLYVSLNSSMIRNHLYFQKDSIRQKINDILDKDELFIKQHQGVAVKNIVLR